jgi:hypothetical protein
MKPIDIFMNSPTNSLEAVFADHDMRHMLEYVKLKLLPVDKLAKSGARMPFRSRYGHSVRVLGWALRLYAAMNCTGGAVGMNGGRRAQSPAPGGANPQAAGRASAHSGGQVTQAAAPASAHSGGQAPAMPDIPRSLAVAAIFHDVGYSVCGNSHAKFSEEIFRGYAKENRLYAGGHEKKTLDEIASIIAVHSDKRLPNEALTVDQQLLMDADMLDESGALRFAWICFDEAEKPEYGYASAYERMRRYLGQAEADAASFHTDAGRAAHFAMLESLQRFADAFQSELQL